MKYFVLILLLLLGCSKQSPKDVCLKISFNTTPSTTDPTQASDFVSSTLACMLYEGLTRFDSEGKLQLSLAESIQISPDRKTYTFFLKKAFWSNEEPITAFDFERSWKKSLSPPAPCSFLFYPIKNAEKFSRQEALKKEIGVYAVDDHTLVVELERPTPYFPNLVASTSFLIAHPNPNVFSGPFQIQKMSHNHEIVLEKNPNYWNANQIHLDLIHISIIPDEMTAYQMFERKELDWIGGSLSPLPPDAIETLSAEIHPIPSAASTLCSFNTQTFPFSNENLRKAFSLAIERTRIVEKLTQNCQIPARSFLPPSFSKSSFFLSDSIGALFYFEKALEELNLSPQNFPPITLYYRPGQMDKRLAQALQKQWQKTFNIKVHIVQLDFKSHTQKLQKKDYTLALCSWIAQFEDPVSLLDRFKYKDHLKNYPGWQNEEFLSLLEKIATEEERSSYIEKAEEILANAVPLTPIYHWSSPSLCSSSVQKLVTSPCGGVLFELFELNEQ